MDYLSLGATDLILAAVKVGNTRPIGVVVTENVFGDRGLSLEKDKSLSSLSGFSLRGKNLLAQKYKKLARKNVGHVTVSSEDKTNISIELDNWCGEKRWGMATVDSDTRKQAKILDMEVSDVYEDLAATGSQSSLMP